MLVTNALISGQPTTRVEYTPIQPYKSFNLNRILSFKGDTVADLASRKFTAFRSLCHHTHGIYLEANVVNVEA